MTTQTEQTFKTFAGLIMSAGEADELRFQTDDGEEMTVLVERIRFGHGGKSDLYWAHLLRRRMELDLEADEAGAPVRDAAGRAKLAGFRPADERSIARLVSELDRPVERLGGLMGLMDFRVSDTVPRVYSMHAGQLVDMLEVIRWTDGSVTQVEYHRSSFTGAISGATMLPPCDLLSELPAFHELEDPPDGWSGPQKHLMADMMVEVSAIARSYNSIREHLERAGHSKSFTALRVVLSPAALLSFAVRQRIIQALLRSHAEERPAL